MSKSLRATFAFFILSLIAVQSGRLGGVSAAAVPGGMRMGYPQPRGAMPPIWVMTEATLDHTKIRR